MGEAMEDDVKDNLRKYSKRRVVFSISPSFHAYADDDPISFVVRT